MKAFRFTKVLTLTFLLSLIQNKRTFRIMKIHRIQTHVWLNLKSFFVYKYWIPIHDKIIYSKCTFCMLQHIILYYLFKTVSHKTFSLFHYVVINSKKEDVKWLVCFITKVSWTFISNAFWYENSIHDYKVKESIFVCQCYKQLIIMIYSYFLKEISKGTFCKINVQPISIAEFCFIH
jgi:hypothetical protein